jgi:acetyl CoA:N6-hydroxylysine acetyl transferase
MTRPTPPFPFPLSPKAAAPCAPPEQEASEMTAATDDTLAASGGAPAPCRALGRPLVTRWADDHLTVALDDHPIQRWRLLGEGSDATLTFDGAPDTAASITTVEIQRLAALAALDAAFVRADGPATLRLLAPDALAEALRRDGVAVEDAGGGLWASVGMLFQRSDLWLLAAGSGGYPQTHVLSNGRYHPRRPPKPQGTLYARHIPWLGQTLSFRVADPARDLERFHRWQNDPRVAAFWQETGDLDHHRAYLDAQTSDPHTMPLIASLDGAPFGYFEVYWAKENRIGAYYDAQDYDRGWHVLIGEEHVRGRAYVSAWLPSLVHFMFLDDPRTQRIVGEPRADHHQQIRNLDRSGFAKVKEFDFPHKRAMLVMLLRERYCADRLWVPRADPVPSSAAASRQGG